MGILLGEAKLAAELRRLVRSEVGTVVRQRMAEFHMLGEEGVTHFNFRPFIDAEYDSGVFSELCFCILTANSTARRGIQIQKELGDEGFSDCSPKVLASKLKQAGHRFPNSRAKFIVEARKFENVEEIIENFGDVLAAREWLVKNVKGIGWKEASHFLRNVGRNDVAILDRHVLSVLREHQLISKVQQTLSKATYLEVEKRLEQLAKKLRLSLGEMDLYLWCMKTGCVLK
jgi:N-glycosylase/DNA lyase